MTHNRVIDNTPWEVYPLNGTDIHVKREDLCSPYPGPAFSKVRGLEHHLARLAHKGLTTIGVLDTFHSKAGWGIAWLCEGTPLTCINYYPRYKGETALRENQEHSSSLGAILQALPAGRSSILWHIARRHLLAYNPTALMLPNGLSLRWAARATAAELLRSTPTDLLYGTWVVSVSSGTLAEGVARGLLQAISRGQATLPRLILHLGFSRSHTTITNTVNYPPYLTTLVDENYEYREPARGIAAPFPCNPYYDLKAWKWLTEHVRELTRPIIFWNIGA